MSLKTRKMIKYCKKTNLITALDLLEKEMRDRDKDSKVIQKWNNH